MITRILILIHPPALTIIEMLPVIIRKRTITETEFELIQSTVAEYWNKGGTHISRILCKKWNWIQANGSLKDMACREILLTLERMVGLLRLPPEKDGVRTNTCYLLGL